MLGRAHAVFDQLEIGDVTRVDVPAKGAGEEGVGALRGEVQAVVPALQSGSLFGDRSGVLVVDAQSLLKAETTVIAELIGAVDVSAVAAVFVAAGAVPAPLGRTLKDVGESIVVKRLNERGTSDWLQGAARDRGLRIDGSATEALIQRFGTDVASLGQALDQFVATGEDIDAEAVMARFRNRPDEPSWL